LLAHTNIASNVCLIIMVVVSTIAITMVLLFPLCIGLSILRHHLWDIDFLISRVALYAILTGTLTLAYVISIVVLQQMALAFTSQPPSSVVIAISTLALAALLQPWRHTLQKQIDRHWTDLDAPAVSAEEPTSVTLTAPLDEPLSRRELEVLHLIAYGLSNQQIAAQLAITEGTVKRHTSNIYGKLGVRSRTQALARSRLLNLLK
jgi:ATP/maltotriose-dependent transcriptional regulator MalT